MKTDPQTGETNIEDVGSLCESPHLVHKDEAYKIIGICMNVYNELGNSYSEVVYKDAIAYFRAREEVRR
jgi:hypothetical protein